MTMPGMMPPLQLSLGSSAGADSRGGSAQGSGMGAINLGDWIIQTTGQGNNSATPLPDLKGNWPMLALGAVAAWFFLRR
jgi:hypothetical protein